MCISDRALIIPEDATHTHGTSFWLGRLLGLLDWLGLLSLLGFLLAFLLSLLLLVGGAFLLVGGWLLLLVLVSIVGGGCGCGDVEGGQKRLDVLSLQSIRESLQVARLDVIATCSDQLAEEFGLVSG